ncbi:MAG: hypothetical protein FWC60_02645, partial [Firmicutes bacterium]|nr:hypothetical protein [Bacillota bacterium]
DEIEMLKPYGHGNPCPVLAVSDARLLQCRGVGKNEAHLRITVGENEANLNGIGFNLGKYADELAATREVSLAFTPTINEWQGRSYLQLKVNDLQGETRFQNQEQNPGEENYFPGAGELVFFPETMLARLRDYLLRAHHALPGALSLFKAAGTNALSSQSLPASVTGLEPEPVSLHKLEPGENMLLLLVNSARHTVQLARYFARRPGFGGSVSYLNGFMDQDHLRREQHKITNGAAKVLISTYACQRNLMELTTGRPGLAVERIILVRPPAFREDWQSIAAGANVGGSVLVQAAYRPDDWQKSQLPYIDELAPEREILADFYKILRSLAPEGAAVCPVDRMLTLMGRLGRDVASIMLAAVAAAIFKDLGLLQYDWEEDMLKYKLLPGDGRRRELNESDAFVWTRRIKGEWLDWVRSGPGSYGA